MRIFQCLHMACRMIDPGNIALKGTVTRQLSCIKALRVWGSWYTAEASQLFLDLYDECETAGTAPPTIIMDEIVRSLGSLIDQGNLTGSNSLTTMMKLLQKLYSPRYAQTFDISGLLLTVQEIQVSDVPVLINLIQTLVRWAPRLTRH